MEFSWQQVKPGEADGGRGEEGAAAGAARAEDGRHLVLHGVNAAGFSDRSADRVRRSDPLENPPSPSKYGRFPNLVRSVPAVN